MSQQPVRILLVDAVRVFRELERTFLQRSAYEIFTAATGTEALEKAHRVRPHLILLDCNMPGMDGFECCRRIKADPILKGVKVIMVTTHGREQDRERCLEAGCDDFLTKPVNRRAFLSSVEQTLSLTVRVADRLAMSAKVYYTPGDGAGEPSVTANVSVGGVFILSEKPPAEGTPLHLRIDLPGLDSPIEVEGEVVWNTSEQQPKTAEGFGVKFTRIDLDTARLIERFVAARVE